LQVPNQLKVHLCEYPSKPEPSAIAFRENPRQEQWNPQLRLKPFSLDNEHEYEYEVYSLRYNITLLSKRVHYRIFYVKPLSTIAYAISPHNLEDQEWDGQVWKSSLR
jgi:hypothetical protein